MQSPRSLASADHAAPWRHGDQTMVPMMLYRGGTSRGPFFRAQDLPPDEETRDQVLLHAMGSPHVLQVDGIGGGHPLTSKVGIVAPSSLAGADLDFTFAQLQPDGTSVQTTANCGNMLSAVLPFAIEQGMVAPQGDRTTAVVRTTNTGLLAEICVETPETDGERHASSSGNERIAGVPGTSSPIRITFLDTAGSIADSLFPSGRRTDCLELPDGTAIEATLIDNGQPMALVRATDLGCNGSESPSEMQRDQHLKDAVESIRLQAGDLMGLGDVTSKSYPKITLISPPTDGGCISTRCFIPHVVHESIGVLAAVTVASAVCLEGTVPHELGIPGTGRDRTLGVEHPSGTLPVDLVIQDDDVEAAGITRTARLLLAGATAIPRSVWNPDPTTTDHHEESA